MPRPAPVALLALAAALTTAPATAHEKRAVRTATATARAVDAGVELDVMLWLRFAGPRAEGFRARFDVDRSGQLEAGESALAGDALAAETIGGFFVRFDGAARPPDRADAKARIDDQDGLEVAVLLSWAATPASALQLAARPGRDKDGAPVIVARFAALPPLRLLDADPPGGRPTPLMPGGEGLKVRVVRPDPLAPAAGPAPMEAPR